MIRFRRRDVLRALGVFGAAYFLPSLRSARAQQDIPRRFLIFYTQHGELSTIWKPKGVGGAEPSETAWELSDLHSPLQPFKSKLNLLAGLDFQSRTLLDNTRAFGNGHEQGIAHSLAPYPQTPDAAAGGISIDQFIANELRAQGKNTLLSSLHIHVTRGDPNAAGEKSPSYSAAGQFVASEVRPLAVYDRLFPNGPISSGGGEPPVDSRVLQRKSVLDFVAQEFSRARPDLGKIDRDKLAAHGQAIRDLELSLATKPITSGGCPYFERVNLEPDIVTGRKDPAVWTTSGEQMAKLIQVAFACDLTRVINLGVAHPNDELIGYTPGAFGTPTIHELEHVTGNGPSSETANLAQAAITTNARKRYVDLFAKILGLLDEIPEGDGQTMLDHTAVLYCGEISYGNHTVRNNRWILAGSCGGAFRTGRYLQFGSNYGAGGYDQNPGAQPHSNLFVSLARAMGSSITSFGMSEACTGPLTTL
jgi:hypothetical protein